MTTQISNLRSGTKNQLQNTKIDYSTLPSASSHVGHIGSNHNISEQTWKHVTSEHPEQMKVRIKGIEIDLDYCQTSDKRFKNEIAQQRLVF
jgi:hypothetical protein